MNRRESNGVAVGPVLLAVFLCAGAPDQPSFCPELAVEHAETASPNRGLWNMDIGDLDGDGDLERGY